MFHYLGLLLFFVVSCNADPYAEIIRVARQAPGGFSFNPSPFWCSSTPQFAPCAQPAIPICCGPCYQAQPMAAVPAGTPGAGGTGGTGGTAPAGGTGGTAPAKPAPAIDQPPAQVPAQTAAPVPVPAPAPAGGTGGTGGTAPAGGTGGTPGGGGAGTPAPAGGTGAVPGAGGAGTPAPGAGAGTPAPAAPGGNSTANCPVGCPSGWNTWNPLGSSCYLMPAQPLHSDTFWNQQAYCKSKEPTSNILVIDDLVEQALATGVSLQYFPSWAAQGTNIYWWLGGYTDTAGKWNFVDGTDQSKSPLMLLAQIAGILGVKNDTCVGAEAKTLGAWQTYGCEETTGAVICEMPKRPVCGEQGSLLPITKVDLSPEKLKDLFPKAPSIPFISGLLGGGGTGQGLGLGSLLGKK